jgi:hypothetical protein
MVRDRDWPCGTLFQDAIGDVKLPPFLMLRTLKSNTVAGVSVSKFKQMSELDADWMTNGKYGLVQYHQQ